MAGGGAAGAGRGHHVKAWGGRASPCVWEALITAGGEGGMLGRGAP